MSIDMSNDGMVPKNVPTDMDACETVASQEEIYLERTEETLRAILISEDPSTYVQQETGCVDCCFVADSLDEELDHAAEELITGDSDDPPLSEEAVVEMLKMASNARGLNV
jgi:hypothetical protein